MTVADCGQTRDDTTTNIIQHITYNWSVVALQLIREGTWTWLTAVLRYDSKRLWTKFSRNVRLNSLFIWSSRIHSTNFWGQFSGNDEILSIIVLLTISLSKWFYLNKDWKCVFTQNRSPVVKCFASHSTALVLPLWHTLYFETWALIRAVRILTELWWHSMAKILLDYLISLVKAIDHIFFFLASIVNAHITPNCSRHLTCCPIVISARRFQLRSIALYKIWAFAHRRSK